MVKYIMAKILKDIINTEIIGKKVFLYSEITSTNDIAITLAKAKEEEGAVVLAREQTAGRGRRGRQWFSPSRGGLWCSVILKPLLNIEKLARINIMITVSIAETINAEIGIKPQIKWPNDILIGNKKVGGILTEVSLMDQKIDFIIAGIGINTDLSLTGLPEDIRHKTGTLKEFANKKFLFWKFFRVLLAKIDYYYKLLNKDMFEIIKKLWQEYNLELGKNIQVSYGEKTVEGRLINIDDNGNLLLRLDSGIQKIIAGGEIAYIEAP